MFILNCLRTIANFEGTNQAEGVKLPVICNGYNFGKKRPFYTFRSARNYPMNDKYTDGKLYGLVHKTISYLEFFAGKFAFHYSRDYSVHQLYAL